MRLKDYLGLLLVVFIAFFSVGQILRLYFSYEDFSLLYGIQFPDDQYSIFKVTGVVAYLFSQPLLTPQYFLFSYNPLGYYFVSLILFLIFLFLFYQFLCLFYPQNEKLAFISTLITASGYVGVESLTWNVGGGQLHLALLISAFFAMTRAIIFFESYKKQKRSPHFFVFNRRKIIEFILMVVALIFAIYFFQFRSYLLFVWVPLVVFAKILTDQGKVPKRLVVFVGISFIVLSLLFSQSIGLIMGRISHLNLDISVLLNVYLKNLANLFFPSDLVIGSFYLERYSNLTGIFAFFVLLLPPIYLFLRKCPLVWVASFFSLAILLSLVVIMIVIAFVGQSPVVWPSSHRFYIVLLPFVSGYLAVLLALTRPKIQLPILVLIVTLHIWFSNYVIFFRWESLSRHLKYFYEGVTTTVPNPDKSSVFLTTLTRPWPPGPFVSGSHIGSGHYLAGFYHRKFGGFYLETEPLDAVKLLIDNNLSPLQVFAFDYKRDDLVDETRIVRDILTSGRATTLGNNLDGKSIEFNNLDIKLATPLFLKARLEVIPEQIKKAPVELNVGSLNLPDYFNLWFSQEGKRENMKVSSELQDMGTEHKVGNLIDGKYETTWIPQNWSEQGANITVDLGSLRKIYSFVWSSSRTTPWVFRSPSEYEVLTSQDGSNFERVIKVENVRTLKTGEYFIDNLNGKSARFIRLNIKKTHGGWTPAVDEIEVFDQALENRDLENYFLVKSTPLDYFPNQEIMLSYYNQILQQNIPVEINWMVDGDSDYLAGQAEIVDVKGGVAKDYLIPIPKTGRAIKSLRIRTNSFPSKLKIRRIEAWQPSIEEFRANKNLLEMKY